MNMNHKPGRIKGLLFFALLMTVTAIALAIQHKVFDRPISWATAKVKSSGKHREAPVYDKALLKKFETVCQAFNMQKAVFTCSGVINVTDGADSSKTIRDLRFTMCKNGNNCYYRFGQVETLNADGTYICIENDRKRVVVTRQKDLVNSPVPDIAKVAGMLEADYYNLTDTGKGKNETIAFVNERHISCKEYAVTFDTVSKKVNHVFTRLTNFHDPDKKEKEKTIDISITGCDDNADLSKYPNRSAVITAIGGKVKLTAKYKGYELIIL